MTSDGNGKNQKMEGSKRLPQPNLLPGADRRDDQWAAGSLLVAALLMLVEQ